jgi:hypothetical protein
MKDELVGTGAIALILAAFLWCLCTLLVGPGWALIPALGIAGAYFANTAREIRRAWRPARGPR